MLPAMNPVQIAALVVIALWHKHQVLAGVSTAAHVDQRFAMEPQDQTAIVGSRVTLPCRVIGKNGMLQWTKDDFGLGNHRNLSGFERYSMVGSDEEGDFSLDIYPVMLDDDARYQCQVGPSPKGTPGIRSRFATLTVLVPPEPPKIVQGDFLLTTEDREIELECTSVGGKPAAEITWIDGHGNVLLAGIDYMKEPFADSRRFTAKSILKLTPKKEHHNTTFTCQAQNTADRTYRSAKLKLEVKYAPKVTVTVVAGTTPAAGSSSGGARLLEGADVTLACGSDANPSEVTYRWYVNEELVVGDYTTEMTLHNISRKYHDAIVKCEVHNAVGKSEETETLDVSYGPIFHVRPKSVEADTDGTVSLSCEVDGNPTPDITWINVLNERIVGTSPNLTVTVTPESAGVYQCRAAVPGFAEVHADATIFLKGPPSITSTRQQFAIAGDNARLECIAFSVPKARHVSWTFNGREINTSLDQDYAILEEALPEGIRSTLVIRESAARHFGRYNCTVVNDHGNDVMEIDLTAQKTVPSLMIVVGSVSSLAVLMMVIMLFVLYFRKGTKKLPPADVIPEQHLREKGFKESDRTSNISDLKADIRAGSCEPDGTESCSGTDSIATRIAANILSSTGSSTGLGGSGGGGGVPLAGPVKIPGDYNRFSGDYTDSMPPAMHHVVLPKTLNTSGHNNNGYVPYNNSTAGDYASIGMRDYAAHPSHTLPNNHNQLRLHNNTTGSNATIHHSTTGTLNGQLANGNLSLTRNRLDLRQDNGLPNVMLPGSMGSLASGGMMAQPSLLQNGLTIDPRYSAAYGNPYLMRTSNSSLPPLPPPSTANPASTPAPPPYASVRSNAAAMLSHASSAAAANGISGGVLGSLNAGTTSSGSPNNSSSNGNHSVNGGASALSSTHTSSATNSNSSGSIATSLHLQQQQHQQLQHQLQLQTQQQQLSSPSGQFILPANGNLKKGSLATHV